MLSAAESSYRTKSWKITLTCRRHCSGSTVAMSTPSTVTLPAVGSWSRVSSLTSVVLPAPLTPTTAVHSPAGSVRSSPSSTVRVEPGYENDTPSNRSSLRGAASGSVAASPVRGAASVRSTSRTRSSNSRSAATDCMPYCVGTSDSG